MLNLPSSSGACNGSRFIRGQRDGYPVTVNVARVVETRYAGEHEGFHYASLRYDAGGPPRDGSTCELAQVRLIDAINAGLV